MGYMDYMPDNGCLLPDLALSAVQVCKNHDGYKARAIQ